MVNLKNLIRIGTVSSINYRQGKLRVCFEDQDGIVTDELPLLSFEYEMPKIGEPVLCLFLGNGISNGFCLGRYYYDKDLPVPSGYGENIYYKQFLRDAFLSYDRSSETLTIHAGNIILDGEVSITGNLKVAQNLDVSGNISTNGSISAAGSINAAGSIIDGGGNTNHHSHP
jgi:phage baseplate assembly protein V